MLGGILHTNILMKIVIHSIEKVSNCFKTAKDIKFDNY